MARAWLTHLRESAIDKLQGLDDGQLRWRPAPTANSLGVIVVHLGYAERLWLRAVFAGEEMDMGWRSRMFELPDGWSVNDVVAFYRAETAAANAVLDRAESFDLLSSGDLRPTTLRWAVDHVIEETARMSATWTSPGSSRREHRALRPGSDRRDCRPQAVRCCRG